MLRTLASGVALAAALAMTSCTTPADTQTASADPLVTAAHSGDATAASKAAGEDVYKQHCAACHDNPEATKAPARDALKRVSALYITNALIMGKMVAQGAPLSAVEVSNVSDYLSGGEADATGWIAPNACTGSRRTPKLDVKATISGFGYDYSNKRQLTDKQTGLKPGDLDNMEVAWTMAFPQVGTMRGQAAIVGDTMFLPVADNNRVFALDISGDKPCVQWSYDGGRALRTSAGYGELSNGQKVIMVGDMGGFVHAIDARTGKKLWVTNVSFFKNQMVTSTPVLYKDRVYAPISQYELASAMADAYVCCKARGGVTAINAKTGEKIWAQATMPEAQPIKDRGDGQFIWGPSGAPIWNSPSLDLKRNRLFVGTGEANSGPAHPNTDALLAFDLDSGKIVWSHQATADDVYNAGCAPGRETNKNCSGPTVYRDVDFGASTIFTKAPNGTELVLAGQKSGSMWAMNPETGAVVWRTALGHGTAMGGVHWGMATDGKTLFVPISDLSVYPKDAHLPAQSGMHALDIATGKALWSTVLPNVCNGAKWRCSPGVSAAATFAPGVVFGGSLDGTLRAFSARGGEVLWTFDTNRQFEAVNGITGSGGSIDSSGPVVAGKFVYATSGYDKFGQKGGNLLLAFNVGN